MSRMMFVRRPVALDLHAISNEQTGTMPGKYRLKTRALQHPAADGTNLIQQK